MKIIRKIEEIKSIKSPTAITLGNFDGIHAGHKKLIDNVLIWSKEHNTLSVVVTYFPNPAIVLGKNSNFQYLLSEKLKEIYLEEAGFDYAVIIPFSKEFAHMEAESFITEILVNDLQAQYISIGYNHHFGRERQGNFDLLYKYQDKYNYIVEKSEPVMIGDEKVSSSAIRNYLTGNHLDDANRLLSRCYEIDGIIAHGHSRGHEIGFPTANLQPENDILIPHDGVYAGNVILGERTFNAMINIGRKPTFGDRDISIEAHIFDFAENIYGQYARIRLVKKIRDEIRFPSVEMLISQLHKDEKEIRAVLQEQQSL